VAGLDPPYVEPILGIVFDLDGTLVLSRHDFPRMRAAVVMAAEHHGLPKGTMRPGDSVAATMAAARDALAALQAPEGAVLKFEAEANRLIDAVEMEALPSVVARPGAPALLAELQRRSYRLAVLTRSSEAFARAALHQAALDPYFPYLRSRSAPGPSKPSPEALEILLKEMGVPPARALLVGDHPHDAETAVGARVRFYAVLAEPPAPPDAPSLDRFRRAGASAVAPDLFELARQLGLPMLPGAGDPTRPGAPRD